MKKLATIAIALTLAACETMPPQDRAQWENTSVDDVNCTEYGDFGTTRGLNYGLSGFNTVAGLALGMPIIATIGVFGLATAELTASSAEFCSEFAEYKKNGNNAANQAEFEAFKAWQKANNTGV